MAFSVRGLTRGVMGGVTAYRRGALQGEEQNREIAAAEQARERQKAQDEQAALYRQVEASLAERRQKATEEQSAEANRIRELTLKDRPTASYQPTTRAEMLADATDRARINARYRPTDTPDRPTTGQMQTRLAALREELRPKDENGAPMGPLASVEDAWAQLETEYGVANTNRLPISQRMRRPVVPAPTASPAQAAWDNLPGTAAEKTARVGPRPAR